MDIAIIGQAVEVPEASDPQALWDLVAAGRSLTRPFPARRRQDVEEFVRYRDRTALDQRVTVAAPEYHQASYLDRIDLFDHEFFGMTQAQAVLTDPHQRLLHERPTAPSKTPATWERGCGDPDRGVRRLRRQPRR